MRSIITLVVLFITLTAKAQFDQYFTTYQSSTPSRRTSVQYTAPNYYQKFATSPTPITTTPVDYKQIISGYNVTGVGTPSIINCKVEVKGNDIKVVGYFKNGSWHSANNVATYDPSKGGFVVSIAGISGYIIL